MDKPRINIEVDDKLKHKVQTKALKEKKTLTEIIIYLLKQWLKKSQT